MIVTFSPLFANGTGPLGSASTHVDERAEPLADPLIPAFNLGPKRRYRKRPPPVAGHMDMRRNYQKASWIWSLKTEAQRLPWRQAIKRSGISAYDVWMRGALYNFARALNAPDEPGPSLGCWRACRKKPKTPPATPPIPGEEWHPPPQHDGWWDWRTDPDFIYEPECDGSPSTGCGYVSWFCEPYAPSPTQLVMPVQGLTQVWLDYNGAHILDNNVVDGCIFQATSPWRTATKIGAPDWWCELWHVTDPVHIWAYLETIPWCLWPTVQLNIGIESADPMEFPPGAYPGWEDGEFFIRQCA